MNGKEAREEFDKKLREIEEKKIKQNQIKEKEQEFGAILKKFNITKGTSDSDIEY